MFKFILGATGGFVTGVFAFAIALNKIHYDGRWEEFTVRADEAMTKGRREVQVERRETVEDILKQYGLR